MYKNYKRTPIAEEAMRGFIDITTDCSNLRKKHKQDMENLRTQMTRNYRLLMEKIEENYNQLERRSDEEIAKKWIRDNLEEAQKLIDNIVGIKGITEDPLKVAAELEGMGCADAHAHGEEMPYGWNVIAANTAGTLQRELLADAEEKDMSHVYVSPPHEELFGY
jgi:hypothetical protein